MMQRRLLFATTMVCLATAARHTSHSKRAKTATVAATGAARTVRRSTAAVVAAPARAAAKNRTANRASKASPAAATVASKAKQKMKGAAAAAVAPAPRVSPKRRMEESARTDMRRLMAVHFRKERAEKNANVAVAAAEAAVAAATGVGGLTPERLKWRDERIEQRLLRSALLHALPSSSMSQLFLRCNNSKSAAESANAQAANAETAVGTSDDKQQHVTLDEDCRILPRDAVRDDRTGDVPPRGSTAPATVVATASAPTVASAALLSPETLRGLDSELGSAQQGEIAPPQQKHLGCLFDRSRWDSNNNNDN